MIMKKLFCLFLALCLLSGLLPALSPAAEAAEDSEGIEWRIQQILDKCADKSYFTVNGQSCTHKTSGDGQICANFC